MLAAILPAILKALHVLAVVLWVGGMAFAHFFLRPSLALLDPPQRVRLMHAVLGRFFQAVLWAVVLIFVSGFGIAGLAARQAGAGFAWPLDWQVMAVVGVFMIALFGHIRFVLYRRLDRAVQAGDWPAGGAVLADIRRWVGVNLALGLGLIALVLVV